ncbi:MAG: hypothetical protein H8E73_09245 [Planctomycetes bacterium]|nr:hypothetical protein [Planctomycetota bacterium]
MDEKEQPVSGESMESTASDSGIGLDQDAAGGHERIDLQRVLSVLCARDPTRCLPSELLAGLRHSGQEVSDVHPAEA